MRKLNEEKATVSITFKLTEQEKADLVRKAWEKKKSLSQYLRDKLFGK